MQNVIPALSETPGRIDHPGPELGEHNREVYVGELGLSEEELERLEAAGAI
jgi:crotonobetainyl-CoA:carnitine CoA-transferase CaiB-like acyl-CoA transferase